MEIKTATRGFAALAQETRLKVFRRLMRTGTEGVAAGNLARSLRVPHNTLSSHLRILQDAGWITSRRQGRSVIYCVDLAGTRRLLAFLVQNCCNGRPEVCAPLLDDVVANDAPVARSHG